MRSASFKRRIKIAATEIPKPTSAALTTTPGGTGEPRLYRPGEHPWWWQPPAQRLYGDGRPHLPPGIRQWMGDSRGHWEGKTLIVDTTNFTDKTPFRGSDRNLHLVERFTRTDAETILYEFTVDDPTAFTKAWKGEAPMTRAVGPIYEYACHEGNYGMTNILSGARAEEKGSR